MKEKEDKEEKKQNARDMDEKNNPEKEQKIPKKDREFDPEENRNRNMKNS